MIGGLLLQAVLPIRNAGHVALVEAVTVPVATQAGAGSKQDIYMGECVRIVDPTGRLLPVDTICTPSTQTPKSEPSRIRTHNVRSD